MDMLLPSPRNAAQRAADIRAADLALTACRNTHREPNPCLDPAYLDARRQYHEVMMRLGLLNPKDIPCLRPTRGTRLT